MNDFIRKIQNLSPILQVAIIAGVVFLIGLCCCSGWFLLQTLTAAPSESPPDQAFVTATPGGEVVSGETKLPTPVTFNAWKGEYFDNLDLKGESALVRDDEYINFDWGVTAPGPGVPAENFSVRWTIARDVPADIYRFSAEFDGGMRVWIDDSLIIDQWLNGPSRTASADIELVAGEHAVQVEYFHVDGPAAVKLTITNLQNFPNWKAEYFDQPNFNNPPVAVKSEQKINYNWGDKSPIPGVIPDNNFAIRWTRGVYTDEGTYLLRIYVEGGVRLWIDGQIVLDSWSEKAFRQVEESVPLTQGDHGFILEYFKETGNGQISTDYVKLQKPKEPPLAVIKGPTQAQIGETVDFSASSSSAAEGSKLVSFEWDFGDGSQGSGIYVSHAYNTAGTYEVKMIVTDDTGLQNETTHQITIAEAASTPEPGQTPDTGSAPLPFIDAPSQAIVGQSITFDASQSWCSGECVSYLWDLGDGTRYNAVRIRHAYHTAAVYNVMLTVTDEQGRATTLNKPIDVKDQSTPVPTETVEIETPVPADTPEP